MNPRFRIAVQINVADPYWVLVREALVRQLTAVQCELVTLPIPVDELSQITNPTQIFEELRVQQVHALVCNSMEPTLLSLLRSSAIPVIDASESTQNSSLYTSRRGLYDAAYSVGCWLAERLPAGATVWLVGGFDAAGQTRLDGIQAALTAVPQVQIVHLSCQWLYHDGYAAVAQWLAAHPEAPCAAIFGLSDSLALGARDALRAHAPQRERPLVCGINGDPLALADIGRGQMDVTVETIIDSFASEMLQLALQGIQTGMMPRTYDPQRRFIDATNVADVAMEQLIALAGLPSRLVGYDRQRESERVRQQETSLAITQQVGAILDRDELIQSVTTLIRANYGYDSVTLWRFDGDGNLTSHTAATAQLRGTPLAAALSEERAIYIPDTLRSLRFDRSVHAPDTRTRVVLPVRYNDTIVGLLDLQHNALLAHVHGEIEGLQLVANQIGIALQNIDLFQAARAAQQAAEQADRLKTRLLANVSHELRTPLHIILGYSQLLISEPAPHGVVIGDEIRNDIATIQRSAEHLVLLINDLLDLSRAEIDELVLFPEYTDIHALLESSFTELMTTQFRPGVLWQRDIPEPLPLLYIDPTRVRQVLFNLLGNAAKFTQSGSIVLGAVPEPPYVHIWVRDTGVGIAPEQHEKIFEPFVTLDDPTGSGSSESTGAARESGAGVGLGLAITRRLVALHRGILTVESTVGHGSTFHIYLPVRSLTGDSASPHHPDIPVVLARLGDDADPAPSVRAMAQRIGAPLVSVDSVDGLVTLAEQAYPVALIWESGRPFAAEQAIFERIQAHPVLSRVPFFVYDSARRGDAFPVIQKPFTAEQLTETLTFLTPPSLAGVFHIVIVDDDPRLHTLYREVIAQTFPGALVTSCLDGAQLEHALRSVPTPSLFLLDLVMPGQDGFTTLEWIRNQPALARVPVVVLSGKVLSRSEVQRLQYPLTLMRPKVGNTAESMADVLRHIAGNGLSNPPHLSTAARHALAYIQQHYAERLSRERIAIEAGVSESYLTQVFQNELGVTPWTYLARYRIAMACRALMTTDESVSDIAISVGFDDPGYFSKVFRSETGMSPREYRLRTSRMEDSHGIW
jgi:signal transduction histidine kinase/AraC-like DNA-binding protein